MLPRFPSFAFTILLAASAAAAPLDDAIALFKAKQFPDARAALEKITAAEPTNAAAAHYLGLTLLRRGDPQALEVAVPWLEKATVLDPTTAKYFAAYGGSSLQFANQKSSLSAANKGRDALEKAIALDPNDLDSREGVYQFYHNAPWPIGSSSKAAVQLAEIKKRDPDRWANLSISTKVRAKDYAGAFKLMEELIAKNPENYLAHYQYGRTAAVADLNLPAGLTHLQKCLTLTPPGPAAPTHSNVWNRIGNIHEKLKQPTEARTAYETALKLDSANKAAADSLAKLK